MKILSEILPGLEVVYSMNKSMKNKIKFAVILSVLVILFVSITVMFTIFRASEITITGNEICSEKEIKTNYLSGPLGDNTIVIWLKNRFGSFDSVPFVREAEVKVDFPSNVSIRVYEKSLVACFYYMGQYIYFDKDGMILESTATHTEGIPCIEGIAFDNFTMNECISVSQDGQIETILAISELIEHYDVMVDKVFFNNKNEVTLYCGDVKVFLGKQKLYDQQIASVSDVLRQAIKNNLKGTINMKNYKQGDKIILRS